MTLGHVAILWGGGTMRVMLISNHDVERRFANGSQGRLLTWHPGKVQQQKKAISAACHELSCRFAKEASATKPEMLADIDFLDVTVRPRLSHVTKRHSHYCGNGV